MTFQLIENSLLKMDSLISNEFIKFIEEEQASFSSLKTSVDEKTTSSSLKTLVEETTTSPDTTITEKSESNGEKCSSEVHQDTDKKFADLHRFFPEDKPIEKHSIVMELEKDLCDFICKEHPTLILKSMPPKGATYTEDQLLTSCKNIIAGKTTSQDVSKNLGIPRKVIYRRLGKLRKNPNYTISSSQKGRTYGNFVVKSENPSMRLNGTYYYFKK